MSLIQPELATPADAPSVLKLIETLSLWLKEKGVQQWSDGFAANVLEGEIERGELYVVRSQGELVASMVLSEFANEIWDDADRAALYLERLAVARSQAGQKTGEALMKWAEGQARSRGLEFIRLVCDARNPVLASYYRRLGYSHLGTKHFAPYKMDFSRFEKRL